MSSRSSRRSRFKKDGLVAARREEGPEGRVREVVREAREVRELDGREELVADAEEGELAAGQAGAGRVAVVELRRRLRADGLQAFAVQFGRDFGEAFPRGR